MNLPRLASFLAAVALGLPGCAQDPLEVAPNVDLGRFQGAWYEVAHFPRKTQQECVGTKAHYKLTSPTEIEVLHECHLRTADGPYHAKTAAGRVPDPGVPAKLTMDFGHAFGEYWILEVGDRYQYAVIGHPSREYLWVLSRTPELDAQVLAGALERARASKFDTNRLEFTSQPAVP